MYTKNPKIIEAFKYRGILDYHSYTSEPQYRRKGDNHEFSTKFNNKRHTVNSDDLDEAIKKFTDLIKDIVHKYRHGRSK